MKVTTVLLADDHPVVRHGLRALLSAETDLRVVGEVDDGLQVPDRVEQSKPDVLVVDLMMPGLNGLESTRRVVQRSPRTRVVVLSMHNNEAYVLEALRNGASAYVLKDSSATDLVRAVREVAAGRRYLSPPLSELSIEAYLEKARRASPDPYETLTAREREVLQLSAEGHTSTEIGARLNISPRTAETHRANAMHKLHLRTHTDVVRYAMGRGLLSSITDIR